MAISEKQLAHLQRARDAKAGVTTLDNNEFKAWLVEAAMKHYKQKRLTICKATHPNTNLTVIDTELGGIHISQGALSYTLSNGEIIQHENKTLD